ncbi:MAG: ROK family transcriptional regulator [Pyrinomonadaceae bacterium]|nr:ROK family transcriptional regulator [Pyrinomonadaceae bacterium]
MRKISSINFKTATRGTSREINRQIALNLIRTHQPISRADLSRLMETNRANITFLINELLAEGLVREGATGGDAKRGRKPTFLHLSTGQKCAIAIDVRASRTFLMITDLIGKQLEDIISFPTELNPAQFVASLARRIRQILAEKPEISGCDGIGVVVPGMVDRKTGKVLNAPTLGWRDVDLLAPLQKEFQDITVQIENSGKACALSQIWTTRHDVSALNDLVFVSISDGVGVGVIVNGELMRGRHNTAGEFGHVPLSIDGPKCSCGASGCWEAYISNIATLSRYFGKNVNKRQPQSLETAVFTIEDLIKRARGGDGKALAALHSTAHYLGLGLSSIINAIDPTCIFIGGEITEAWDLIEPEVRAAIKERVLTAEGAKTTMRVVPATEYPRLRGAVALVIAPAFAAPMVA